jgi:putative redox protein
MNTVECGTERPGEHRQTIHVRSHALFADVAVASGGADSAPGPHDYFDTALATCKVATAMWYAKKHGIPFERAEARVERDDTQEHSGKYALHVRVSFFGPLAPEERAALHRVLRTCPIEKLMTTSDVVIDAVSD